MASHTLRLVYDGLEAAHHKMPTSLEKQVTAGAQEFLSAHAYFFTEGRIPANVNDHSRYFRVHDFRQRDGSWEAIFAIDVANVATEFVKEYVRELTKNAAVDAALATKLGFLYLVHRSYKAWLVRRPLTDTVFDRVEPVLAEVQGNRAPIYDPVIECERQRRLLFDRTNSSMSKMTAPIGRSAAHVEVWFDNERLDNVQRRFVSDEEITTAMQLFRDRMTFETLRSPARK